MIRVPQTVRNNSGLVLDGLTLFIRGGRTIELTRREGFGPQVLNLLYLLGQHPNQIITGDDLCDRLRVSYAALKILICRARKLLPADWSIESVQWKGYRLIHLEPD